MVSVVDLEGYLSLKESESLKVFIFLLGDEYPHYNSDSSWVHYVKENVHLVRLTHEEFKMLDIGVHPKLIVYKGGKDLKEYNGVIPLKIFQSEMNKLKRRKVE